MRAMAWASPAAVKAGRKGASLGGGSLMLVGAGPAHRVLEETLMSLVPARPERPWCRFLALGLLPLLLAVGCGQPPLGGQAQAADKPDAKSDAKEDPKDDERPLRPAPELDGG